MKRLIATVCATALRMISAIGMLVILARALPIQLFAALTLGLLCGQIIAIFLDGGVNNEILRFAGVESRENHQNRLNQSAAVRLLLMPAPIMLAFGYGAITENYQYALVFSLATAAALLGALGESYFMGLRATGRYQDELKKTIFLSTLMLLLPLYSFLIPAAAGWCILLARLLSLLNLIDAPRRSLLNELRQNLSLSAIREHYFRIKNYSLDSVFSNISVQLDAMLIALLLGKQTYAIYQPTSRLYVSALSIGSIVGGLSIPKASRMVPERVARRYLMLTFTSVGLLVAVTLFFVLDLMVGQLFGQQFQLNPMVALLLATITLVRFIGAGTGSYLTLRGWQAQRAQINVICTLIVVPTIMLFTDSIETILLSLLISQIFMVLLYGWRSYRSEKYV